MNLLTQNGKIKKTSKEMGVRLFNFGLPAYRDVNGKTVCPFSGECSKICYAQKGAYIWSNVKPAFQRRLEATKRDDFVEVMIHEIKKKRADYVRIHDSGDYYSPKYRDKWFAIMEALPNVRFYSYTTSIPLFKGYDIPPNMDIIFSDGSKVFHTVDQVDERHSIVFDTAEDLDRAGYVDVSQNDLLATKWFNKSNKIGLIKH